MTELLSRLFSCNSSQASKAPKLREARLFVSLQGVDQRVNVV